MSTQHQGEYVTSTAMTVKFEYAPPLAVAPTLYGYAAPALSEGQCKVSLWRYTPTGVTRILNTSNAAISGTIHSWVSASTSYTPTVPGDHVGVFAWKLGGVTAYGITHFYATPASYSPSANGDGRIVAMHYFPRPDARHVIAQTISGELVARQNPS
jgi:hypothetical protein